MKSAPAPTPIPTFVPRADHVVTGYRHASGRTIGHHQPSAQDASGRPDLTADVHRFTVSGSFLDTVPAAEAGELAATAAAAAAAARAAAEQANAAAFTAHLAP